MKVGKLIELLQETDPEFDVIVQANVCDEENKTVKEIIYDHPDCVVSNSKTRKCYLAIEYPFPEVYNGYHGE